MLELNADPQVTVKRLKELISPHCAIPSYCQTLLVLTSPSPLEEDALLADLVKEHGGLELQMIANVKGMVERLRQKQRGAKVPALVACRQPLFRGVPSVIQAVQACILDDKRKVRSEALRTLGSVARKGDGDIIDWLCSYLHVYHKAADMTRAMVEALCEVTDESRAEQVAEELWQLAEAWRGRKGGVRAAAAAALGKLAGEGSPRGARTSHHRLGEPRIAG